MIPFEVVALSPYARDWVALHGRRRSGRRFRDGQGRAIEVGEWRSDDSHVLLAMYGGLDPALRTNGLPPLSEQRQAIWVEKLLSRGPNVVARSGGRVVGHAALVRYDDDSSYGLVLFVHQEWQGAGIEGAMTDVILRIARRRSRVSWRQAARALAPGMRVRLQGIAGAIRFAWIPAFCAALVAMVGQDPRGRAVALAVGLATICLGVVAHAGEIILGRPARRTLPEQPLMSTGEWMGRVR